MPLILAGTAAGLVTFDMGSGQRHFDLEGHAVRAVAPASWKRLWAIVDDREIWRRDDVRSGDWRRVASLDDMAEAHGLEAACIADTRANDPEGILIGTSRARLFRIGGDQRLEVVDGFERAPGRDQWFTPWGGPPDTRTITEDSNNVYVNVHVGGVLRSHDEGETWQPTIDINADVHRVVTGAGHVYAAGARGLSVSDDRGDSWRLSAAGLHSTYCRSVAACGSALLLSASDGPRGDHAALYRSGLEGDRFERCREGLPDWFEGNIDSLCLDALPDGSVAALGTKAGDVYASTDQGSSWRKLTEGIATLHSVLVLP